MKTIDVPALTDSETSWFAAAASLGSVCIRLQDGSLYVLEPRDEAFEREVESLRASDRFMETINRRSEETFTHEEVLKELGLS